MRNVKDLSKTSGTYTNAIELHYAEFTKCFEDKNCDIETFKRVVLDAVKDTKKTSAQINFVNRVNASKNKIDLMFFVTNSNMRGSGLGANINDKFNM